MWQKLSEGAASVNNSSLKRSEEEWQIFQENENKKAGKKTVKMISHTHVIEVPKLEGKFPTGFPSEVSACFASESGESLQAEKIESKLAKLKKDLLVSPRVCLQVQELRAKEASDCDTWKDEISKIIANWGSADLDEGENISAHLGKLDVFNHCQPFREPTITVWVVILVRCDVVVSETVEGPEVK